jgi:hypothetical protein
MTMIRPLILAFAFLSSACAPAWQKHPIDTAASGEQLCAKHQARLITAQGYAAPASWHPLYLQDPEFIEDFVKPFPNRIPPTQSLLRSDLFSIPTTITYCPACQHAADRNRTYSSNDVISVSLDG